MIKKRAATHGGLPLVRFRPFCDGATTPCHRSRHLRCKVAKPHFENFQDLALSGSGLETLRGSFPGNLPQYLRRQTARSSIFYRRPYRGISRHDRGPGTNWIQRLHRMSLHHPCQRDLVFAIACPAAGYSAAIFLNKIGVIPIEWE